MTSKRFQILMALTVVSGFLGGAVSNLLLRGAPAAAQATVPVTNMIRAMRFEVVDDQGKTRAVLGQKPDGRTGLWLDNATGKDLVGLVVGTDDSEGLVLCNAAGKPRAGMLVGPDRPFLGLYDDAGKIIWRAP